MPQIKRYPNRKLYDTEAKRYVTLDELAGLIQAGADIQVIDHESGEDLTNVTLTQVVLEQQKKSSGFLSRSLLTNLIRTGGDTIGETIGQVRKVVQGVVQEGVSGLTGFSPVGGATEIEEQIGKLVEQGKHAVEQAQDALQIDARLAGLLHMLNVPSRNEVQQLQQQMDDLNQKLDKLLELRTQQAMAGKIEVKNDPIAPIKLPLPNQPEAEKSPRSKTQRNWMGTFVLYCVKLEDLESLTQQSK